MAEERASLLTQMSDEDRLVLTVLGARYLQSIVDKSRMVRDMIMYKGSWAAEWRADRDNPSPVTLELRTELEAELTRVLGPIRVEDFDTVLLTILLGRHLDA